MNEPEFVRYLQQHFPFDAGTGIGDDTSVVSLDPAQGKQLVTKDILVEGVHFNLDFITLEELALKSLAVNLSDIAAMGGTPRYFYLGLAFPKHLPNERAFDFFNGLKQGCEQWNVQLAGGDFSSSPQMMVSITMIGTALSPVFRHTARSGDWIAITGQTGESAAGLKCLLAGEHKNGTHAGFIQRHLDVRPEIRTGILLAPYVNAMIDVSDGVLLDLGRVLTASARGARLNYQRFPVSPQLRALCKDMNWNEYELVLAGGEDYVLLFTISKENERQLSQFCQLNTPSVSYSIIGEVTQGSGLIVEDNGKPVKTDRFGYDHFKRP